jgi:tetratricopeptide (TPR) repeat protein
MGLPEAEQLAATERLFDWTIRNIQLDPLPPPLPAAAATVETTEAHKARVSPALRGELGPGYSQLPVQVLLYGHGDALERARIFIQLCRQAGIDAVLLAVDDAKLQTPTPWAVAVLIAGQLFLFDPSLGVPIPGPDGQGIATLEQVAKSPELLEKLAANGHSYPLSFRETPYVIALIDAEPAALSRRMQHLQTALPRNSRLTLAVQPSQLEAKLKAGKRIDRVSLWRVPLDAVLYQIGRFHVLARDQAAFEEYHRHRNVFHPAGPLSQARNLHLQGRLSDTENEAGARTVYLNCRQPWRAIDAMENNPFYRASIGLQEDPNAKTADKQAVLSQMANHARAQKQHATYWLGLSYYEEGNFDSTLEFLGKFTISTDPPSPWESGARYNLARCYEDLGRFDLARQWLESDKTSPQRAGNLLRAKQLAARQPVPNP